MYKYPHTIRDGAEKLIKGIENIEMFLEEDDEWNFHDSQISSFHWDDAARTFTLSVEPVGYIPVIEGLTPVMTAILNLNFEDVFDLKMHFGVPNYINSISISKCGENLECWINGYNICVLCGRLTVDAPRFVIAKNH